MTYPDRKIKRGNVEQGVIDRAARHVTRMRQLPLEAKARVKWRSDGSVWERHADDAWLPVQSNGRAMPLRLVNLVTSAHVASEEYLIESEQTRLERLGFLADADSLGG